MECGKLVKWEEGLSSEDLRNGEAEKIFSVVSHVPKRMEVLEMKLAWLVFPNSYSRYIIHIFLRGNAESMQRIQDFTREISYWNLTYVKVFFITASKSMFACRFNYTLADFIQTNFFEMHLFKYESHTYNLALNSPLGSVMHIFYSKFQLWYQMGILIQWP